MHRELFQGKIQSENPNIVNRWDILIEFPLLQYILIQYKKSRKFWKSKQVKNIKTKFGIKRSVKPAFTADYVLADK